MAESDISKIKNNLDKYIVKPLNFFGFGGFVFDREGETVVSLRNEITDHYAEDNTTIQDQIAVRPKMITLTNYVGELADIVEGGFTRDVQEVTQKLTVLSEALPDLSDAAKQAQEAIRQSVNQGIDTGDSEFPSQDRILDLYSLAKNFTPPITKQEQAYLYFKAIRDQKILLSIETPYEFMTSMAIENITIRQAEDTRFVSEFSVTFKEIRFAQTQFVQITSQGRRGAQAQSTDDRGQIDGTNDDSTLAGIWRERYGGDIFEQ